MKIRNLLLNLVVGLLAFIFGLVWVGVYQFFLSNTLGYEVRLAKVNTPVTNVFDTNNSKSVLSIGFEEDKLSDPKKVEDNLAHFDPEGRYYFFEESKGFGDVFFISVNNKNFEVDSDDMKFGDLIPPKGFIVLEDKDNGAIDGCEMHDYIDIPNIEIEDGKISFVSKKQKGIIYEFKGEFIVKGNFSAFNFDAKVLKGTLKKTKNGKIIAKEELTFGWDSSEKCFH
ncbi:MAG: hypothetical protein ACR2MD_19100 [Aridibacter sp.]